MTEKLLTKNLAVWRITHMGKLYVAFRTPFVLLGCNDTEISTFALDFWIFSLLGTHELGVANAML